MSDSQIAASIEDWQDQNKVLSTFGDVVIAFTCAQLFDDYEIVESSNQYLKVKKDNLLKIFVGSEIFCNFARVAPLIKEVKEKPEICLICIGETADLNKLDEQFLNSSVQLAGLPLSLMNLHVSTRSIHNLQNLAVLAECERKQIAQASEEVKYVLSISRQLNGERDIPKLLNLILQKAREVTRADAGSIYTVDASRQSLRFRFTQNDSIQQNLSEFVIPINDKSVVGNAVIHEQTINIPDLYLLSDDSSKNPFGVKHDSSWDKRIGYESHSMLTMPMFDISHSVIGVIQLINCKKTPKATLKTPEDFRQQVIAFDNQVIEYAEIVAQQAGIALENAKMHDEIEQLFHGFVNASVTAIELRDPTTSGHSHRVAKLTLLLAETLNRVNTGTYRNLSFNRDQLREIEYASLLHDFGKLGVREHVLVKAKKLYPRQFELIQERFKHIKASLEIEYLNQVVMLLRSPSSFPPGITCDDLRLARDKKLAQLNEYFEFICKANEPTVLEQGGFELLRDIANSIFTDFDGERRAYLLQDELKALSVSRGSLTAEEFAEIQSHVSHTYDFLRKIPWGQKLANVPQIAAKHHEKLDGSGYPTSAAAEDIPVQSRMMTIADIFDALTASDRPYKRAVPVDKALDILNMEVKVGKIDKDLFDLFVDAKVYESVIRG